MSCVRQPQRYFLMTIDSLDLTQPLEVQCQQIINMLSAIDGTDHALLDSEKVISINIMSHCKVAAELMLAGKKIVSANNQFKREETVEQYQERATLLAMLVSCYLRLGKQVSIQKATPYFISEVNRLMANHLSDEKNLILDLSEPQIINGDAKSSHQDTDVEHVASFVMSKNSDAPQSLIALKEKVLNSFKSKDILGAKANQYFSFSLDDENRLIINFNFPEDRWTQTKVKSLLSSNLFETISQSILLDDFGVNEVIFTGCLNQQAPSHYLSEENRNTVFSFANSVNRAADIMIKFSANQKKELDETSINLEDAVTNIENLGYANSIKENKEAWPDDSICHNVTFAWSKAWQHLLAHEQDVEILNDFLIEESQHNVMAEVVDSIKPMLENRIDTETLIAETQNGHLVKIEDNSCSLFLRLNHYNEIQSPITDGSVLSNDEFANLLKDHKATLETTLFTRAGRKKGQDIGFKLAKTPGVVKRNLLEAHFELTQHSQQIELTLKTAYANCFAFEKHSVDALKIPKEHLSAHPSLIQKQINPHPLLMSLANTGFMVTDSKSKAMKNGPSLFMLMKVYADIYRLLKITVDEAFFSSMEQKYHQGILNAAQIYKISTTGKKASIENEDNIISELGQFVIESLNNFRNELSLFNQQLSTIAEISTIYANLNKNDACCIELSLIANEIKNTFEHNTSKERQPRLTNTNLTTSLIESSVIFSNPLSNNPSSSSDTLKNDSATKPDKMF